MEKENERASQRSFFTVTSLALFDASIQLAELLVGRGPVWTFHLPLLALGAAFRGHDAYTALHAFVDSSSFRARSRTSQDETLG